MSKIEICGCYHDKQIWSPCDEHRESIYKKAELTDPGWWRNTSGNPGPDGGNWTGNFLTRFTGPRQANTNLLLEHNIDKNDFWYIDSDIIHNALHQPLHNHSPINYNLNDDEQGQLEKIREQGFNGGLDIEELKHKTGLIIANAQSRIIPDYVASLHLILDHGLTAEGLRVDGHSHSKDIAPDKLVNHLALSHFDTFPDYRSENRHTLYHSAFGHFIHNKLSKLPEANHSHGNMQIVTHKIERDQYGFPVV